ncbi:hypothetical protein [Sporichthya sp.]|uniref:hypothetical protein n=1 Tax=Sporichthya sp. TaxID=65475 RepID=UPI0018363E2A|nr:hypothetical protein [Sporichthya sp.]MBA3743353.1 hypothetical protein [Sporichthya sp.]
MKVPSPPRHARPREPSLPPAGVDSTISATGKAPRNSTVSLTVIHGFVGLAGVIPAGRKAIQEVAASLRSAFEAATGAPA